MLVLRAVRPSLRTEFLHEVCECASERPSGDAVSDTDLRAVRVSLNTTRSCERCASVRAKGRGAMR